jgi:hypothetical protein
MKIASLEFGLRNTKGRCRTRRAIGRSSSKPSPANAANALLELQDKEFHAARPLARAAICFVQFTVAQNLARACDFNIRDAREVFGTALKPEYFRGVPSGAGKTIDASNNCIGLIGDLDRLSDQGLRWVSRTAILFKGDRGISDRHVAARNYFKLSW